MTRAVARSAAVLHEKLLEEVGDVLAGGPLDGVQVPAGLDDPQPVLGGLLVHGHGGPQAVLHGVLQTTKQMTAYVVRSILTVPQLPQDDGQAEHVGLHVVLASLQQDLGGHVGRRAREGASDVHGLLGQAYVRQLHHVFVC